MLKKAFGNQRGEVIPGATLRADAWWIEPLMVVLCWAASASTRPGRRCRTRTTTSRRTCRRSTRRASTANCRHVSLPLIGSWWNLSPAFLILWIPGGFRATCYYYRKAYYRSFFGSPPGCAVRDVSQELHAARRASPSSSRTSTATSSACRSR